MSAPSLQAQHSQLRSHPCSLLFPAEAKGCLKGAAVGGVAGHFAGHHGVLGAIGGCAVGHHMANEKNKQSPAENQQQPAPNGGAPQSNQSP